MSTISYAQYTVQDFLNDDSFVRWVTQNDEESNSFWKSFLLQYPGKDEEMQQAIDILKVYRMQKTFANEDRSAAVWNRIDKSINQQASVGARLIRMPLIAKVAAAAIIVAVVLGSFWFFNGGFNAKQSIVTAYGEIKTVTLPDNSRVTLNGNSKLLYASDWSNKAPREVWIEGEAYFEVVHLNRDASNVASHERFIVHGGNINVEVLGTSFNIKNRREKTNIGLLSGKIKVQYEGAETEKNQELIMLPGDYVEYQHKKIIVKKNLEKPNQLTTWRTRSITFNNAPLKEIIAVLEDDYGYKVEVTNSKLMSFKIEGEINVSTVDELLEIISTALEIDVEKNDKRITFSPK